MKVGLDDYLAAGGTVDLLTTLLVDELPAPTAPLYPVWAFPPKIQRYIKEASASLNNIPMGMVGLPLLAFAAGAIGNSRFLEIKRGHRRQPIMWATVVAPTGSAKTPAMEYARRPLQRLQDMAKARWDQERQNLADWETLPKAEQEAIHKPTLSAFPHFVTTDSTKEALAEMAATSPGFTVYRDEVAAWVESFDAYRAGRGGDRQDMLSLWSGGSLKIDRKAAPPLVVARPTISVVGGIQPEQLYRLSRDAGSDGFLARFLWEYQDVPILRWTDAEVSEEAERGIDEIFSALRAQLDQDHSDGYRVRFSDEARARYASWHDQNADAMEDASPLMAAVLAKAPLQLATIALVLHCLWHPNPRNDELSLETMNGAIALMEYHLHAAPRVMQKFQSSESPHPSQMSLSDRIVRKVGNSEAQFSDRWVPHSHISDGIRPRIAPELLRETLAELVTAGKLERRGGPDSSRRGNEYRLRISEDPNLSSSEVDAANQDEDAT